jgi:hypothetical protein
MGRIVVDPVLISRDGRAQSQASSGASSPKQTVLSPAQSPSKLCTDSTSQPSTTTFDTPGSLTTGKLLKAAVANSLTEMSPEEQVIFLFIDILVLSGRRLQERPSTSG